MNMEKKLKIKSIENKGNNMLEQEYRLYRCSKCGFEKITSNLISGIPHCSYKHRFKFVKIVKNMI